MNLLQAAMKDKSARSWRERKVMYRVGTPFKACLHCGDFEIEITESGRERKRYTSGFQVFRSYDPLWVKWTYWCWECGCKDAACWENPTDLGLPPVVGMREAVKSIRDERRRERTYVQKESPRSERVAKLEAEIAALEAMLEKRRK